MIRADFIVIGGGMAGASVSYELVNKGRVVILEREQDLGYHSTGRSAAQFLQSYGNHMVRCLTHASRPFFANPPEAFTDHPLLAPRGALFLAREDQLTLLEQTLVQIKQLVHSARALDVERALQWVPILKRDYLAAAFVEPDSMDMDVAAIHQGYLKYVRRRGGRVVTQAEIKSLEYHGSVWQVRTDDETITAPFVINAAGAWCDAVGVQAGASPLGLIPKRRTAITFQPPRGLDISKWPLVIDVGESFYFKPEAGQILASPADETPVNACDVQPDDFDVAITVDRLEKATTLSIDKLNRRWAGLRTFTADNTPVAGFDDKCTGFFWLAGQGGYGITTAPALARAASAIIANQSFPDDLTELGITRQSLSPTRLRKSA